MTYNITPTKRSVKGVREFWGLTVRPVPSFEFLHTVANVVDVGCRLVFLHIVHLTEIPIEYEQCESAEDNFDAYLFVNVYIVVQPKSLDHSLYEGLVRDIWIEPLQVAHR